MQTDVKSVTVSGTGALGVGGTRTRLKGVYYATTTGGTVAVAEGNGGTTLLTFTVPVGANYFLIPGEGILYRSDPYVTFTTTVGSVTFFYG
jgi:glutamate 5-kinase